MNDWLRDFYEQIDAGRLDVVETLTTENLRFQMGGMPPITGRTDVLEAVRQFLSTLQGHSHRFVNVYNDGDTTVLEAVVTYVRLDGRAVDVPCTSILSRRNGLVDSIRVYLDIAPVYAPVEELDTAGTV